MIRTKGKKHTEHLVISSFMVQLDGVFLTTTGSVATLVGRYVHKGSDLKMN